MNTPRSWQKTAQKLITGWAMIGGIVLICVMAVNLWSVVTSIFARSFPGDFELTEIGVAIAAFCFLPWCQMTGGNVAADIFTSRFSTRAQRFLERAASLIALIFSLLLLWRMTLGMLDHWRYGTTTTILQIPVGLAWLPVLVSLALWPVAALLTLTGNSGDNPDA